MELMEAVLTRRTVPPVKLGPPGPDPALLRRWFEAAGAAPDHGRLVPFRFLLVQGEARSRLGELFSRALLEARPDASPEEREKQRRNPERVPLVILAVARIDPAHPKIPEIEQIAAAAAAIQNLLLAVHASGFAAKWATGTPAYSATVRKGLGLGEQERLLGILYVGTARASQPAPPKPEPEAIVRSWPEGGVPWRDGG